MPTRITLYTKARCHLCEDAHGVVEDVLARVKESVDTRLEMVDITADAEVFARYRHAVPVVEIDGVERFRYRVDPAELERLLRGG